MQILFLFLWQVILIMETITTNALNLQVGGDFSYDDSANDFTWRANDSLVIKHTSAIGKSISGKIKTIGNSDSSAISKTSCNNISTS